MISNSNMGHSDIIFQIPIAQIKREITKTINPNFMDFIPPKAKLSRNPPLKMEIIEKFRWYGGIDDDSSSSKLFFFFILFFLLLFSFSSLFFLSSLLYVSFLGLVIKGKEKWGWYHLDGKECLEKRDRMSGFY